LELFARSIASRRAIGRAMTYTDYYNGYDNRSPVFALPFRRIVDAG